MQIREYIEADLLDIKSLLKENLKFHENIDSLHIRKYSPGDEMEDYEKFIERIRSGDGFCLVAEKDSEIIGFGYAYLIHSETGKIKGHISKIFVNQEYRGMGLGSDILSKLEDFLINNNCHSISLSVFAPNVKAHNLYIKSGYKDRFVEMIKLLES